ncbi:hypothetical protein appser11_20620 [Actinobacillus pleuropneumoniae serovar 11 str. 56153]|nr:hypothetical protein appser2_19450 [Actinobacillus pleuropneumoniae serovar 2 str. S1536]EFM93089.1 hypothetical protein appser9_20490 [Actinobacillus pleuropneumoniae serovar 9 str. CVJ13261]EFM97413.1 hypothetical protein appser11_20620 [Actinobacillus pleuropneumoniae serovar 11 str. 56153]
MAGITKAKKRNSVKIFCNCRDKLSTANYRQSNRTYAQTLLNQPYEVSL